jgi:RNA polymerase sigma factor (sigma-70 family)
VENKEELKLIIEGCLQNNRKSQESLFKLFYGKMLAVCMRYTNDRDKAQGYVQEGFIKVFEKLEKFDYNGSFEGWVRRIMVNNAIDAIRKAKKDHFYTDDDSTFSSLSENPMIEQEEEQTLELKAEMAMEAIQELSPSYRTVFNLYVLENYSHKEIADLLGISEGTSKSNLSKAKFNLQKIIEKKFSNIEE